MSHKSERQRRNRNQRRRAKERKIAKVIAVPVESFQPPHAPLEPSALRRAPELLRSAARALNALERAGFRVQAAHGALITEAGYVLLIGRPGEDLTWQVRTRNLTEFTRTDVDDDEPW